MSFEYEPASAQFKRMIPLRSIRPTAMGACPNPCLREQRDTFTRLTDSHLKAKGRIWA